MAICPFCLTDMLSGRSCTVDALHYDGRRFALPPVGRHPRDVVVAGRCGDCGVERGGLHHLGCDLQACPRCRGQLLSCGCRFDEDGDAWDDEWDDDIVDLGVPLGVDGNGLLMTQRSVGGIDVVVRHADFPDSDITERYGIPVTTALRTAIDVAPDLEPGDLRAMVDDFLGRGLFTLDEAWERLGRPDMETYAGAEIMRRLLRDRRGS